MLVVLGEVADDGVLVIAGVLALLSVGAPLVVLVAGHDLGGEGRAAVGIVDGVAILVVEVDGPVHREVDVGALVELLLDVGVVPLHVEGDVLGVAAPVGEGVREAVTAVPTARVVLGVAGLRALVVATLAVPPLGHAVVDDGARLVVLRQGINVRLAAAVARDGNDEVAALKTDAVLSDAHDALDAVGARLTIAHVLSRRVLAQGSVDVVVLVSVEDIGDLVAGDDVGG